jgi:hypothetical protein
VDKPLSFNTFTWTQDFVAALKELGAVESDEALLRLGTELYEAYNEHDPAEIAQAVWLRWPPETGAVSQ